MTAPDMALIRERLDQFRKQVTGDARYSIGYPRARDLTFTELSDLTLTRLLNNVGDPWIDGPWLEHTHGFEREVVDTIAGLWNAPPGHWGYVTSGASEATLHALDEARLRFGDGIVVYFSSAAHYSVPKYAKMLGLTPVMIRTDLGGCMSLDDLQEQLKLRWRNPACIVATVGTTASEAIDDVAGITALCDSLGINRRRVHVDAAFSGIPLTLLRDYRGPKFDFNHGATSIMTSGHKFFGIPDPCAVVVYNDVPHLAEGRHIGYLGSSDTTITGSRSGNTALMWWWALATLGIEGHRLRAEQAVNLAKYAATRLDWLGWPHQRNPYAMTIVLDSPPAAVLDKWSLAPVGRRHHLITPPGITPDQVDGFVKDLSTAIGGPDRTPRLASATTQTIVPVYHNTQP